jgi:hypothetical protein
VGVGLFLLNRRRNRQVAQIGVLTANTTGLTGNPLYEDPASEPFYEVPSEHQRFAAAYETPNRPWDPDMYATGEQAPQTERAWDPGLYETGGQGDPRATLRRDPRLEARGRIPSPPARPAKK